MAQTLTSAHPQRQQPLGQRREQRPSLLEIGGGEANDVSHVLIHTFNCLISLSKAHYQPHLWNTILQLSAHFA
jgi:hypothetical protein